jgi:hypothetical protein
MERLGDITCPSGVLVVMDGGYLELWSGDRLPESVRTPDIPPGTDLEIVGPDAEAAARAFDRQPGRMLYDIPTERVPGFTAGFDDLCREQGFNAALRALPAQVPHRERIRRALAAGDPGFLVSGVPVVPIGSVPTDRPLPVFGMPADEYGWAYFRIALHDRPSASLRLVANIGVDYARLVFADADALSSWIHTAPIDGLADVVFWGLHADEVAAEFGASRTGTPGDDNYGWLNLPVAEAYERAVALDARRTGEPERRFAYDFRPHSHHWQVMAAVRAAEFEAATLEVGGARLMFAMTSVGDGFFPLHLELDEAGEAVAVRITIQSDDE